MEGIRYECPRCGDTDMRCEVPVVMRLTSDGRLEPVDETYGVENADQLRTDAAAICSSEACDYVGRLSDFEREDDV